MSRGANLSIMGLYNNDPTVLDLMVFPDGFTDEQKQNTKENILIECAEFEFLYANPTVAKNIIGIWSAKEKPYWNRIYQASLLEYNPIENYRRTETETIADDRTEQHSGSDINAATGSDTNARTGTETTDHDASHRTVLDETNVDTLSGNDQVKKTGTVTNAATGSDSQTGSSSSTETHSGTDTENNSIAAYDSNTLVAHDSKETIHGHIVNNTAQGSNSTTYGRTDTQTNNTTDKTEYGKVDSQDHDATTTETHDDTDQLTLNTLETITHGKTETLQHGEKIEHEGTTERSVLAFGNIGVTTSQDMLTQEMEVAKIIQVVPVIIESFKNRFCLLVY